MEKLNPIKDLFSKSKGKDKKVDGKKVEFEDDILNETIKDYEERKRERQFLELQWRLNMNFYDGDQYVYINKNTKNVEESQKLYWFQESEVFNQIAPIVETRLAKLGRLTPIPKTRPATDTDEDISNAKISNKILESTYHKEKFADKHSIANMWSEINGTVIWKTIWDDGKGDEIATLDNEQFKEGDIEVIPVNSFEIYPDSLWHDTVDECQSIIHAKAYTVQEIKDIWGVEVPGEDVNVLSINSSAMTNGGLGNTTSGYRITNRIQKKSAMVLEKWEMPSKKYPKGRLIICTEREMLYIGDLPYKVGPENTYGLPFENQKSIKIAGRFYGASVIERLIPLQRRYNSIKNRKADYINRITIGQMVYEENSVDQDFLEEHGTSPGLMIPYKRGYNPPKYIEFHNLPSTVDTEEDRILADFVRISGVSELSKDSSTPTGVNSGIALGILQEQDDTRLSLTAGYVVESSIEIGKKILRLYKQFADTERIARVTGDEMEVELTTWDSSNITSEDVFMDSQAQSLESLAQRRNMVFDLLGTGLFNDPETGSLSKEGIAKVFDIIDLGNWEMGNDTDKMQIAKAERENHRIVGGEWVDMNTYDDNILHIERHNRFRLTTEYEKMVAENPQLEMGFEYHIMQHIEKVQAMAMQQQQPQQDAVQ